MSSGNAHRRPVADEAAMMVQELGGSLAIVPPVKDTDQSPVPVAAIGTTLVVVVTVDREHQRRRTYFSLPSAQRAADRARARGQHAEVLLCALQPVGSHGEVDPS